MDPENGIFYAAVIMAEAPPGRYPNDTFVVGLNVSTATQVANRTFRFGYKMASLETVRARPGRLSARSVFHSKSGLCGTFVWARRARTAQNGGFRPGQMVYTRSRTVLVPMSSVITMQEYYPQVGALVPGPRRQMYACCVLALSIN